MMKKLLTLAASLVLGLCLFAPDVRAQCDAGWVQANIGGTWKVNNAGGQGYGLFEPKPQINITVLGRGRISIEGSRAHLLSGSFAPEANPQGGVWCSFILDNYPARMAYASNHWWILEIGEHSDKNKIELIRR
jgi:hypothetical protein